MANEMEIASLPDSFSLGSFDHYFCDIKKLKHSIAVAVRFLSTEFFLMKFQNEKPHIWIKTARNFVSRI